MAEDDQSEFWNFMAEEAENLTVASDIPETVFNSVSNVTVIDRAAIENYNFTSVSEALRTVPGVMVLRTYLMHNLPTIRGALQEHYANKVLVMIDNVPMWNAVTGEGDLDRVGIDSVERIEILLGPASVLYGSNALTGAINIVLRKAPGKNARLGRLGGGLSSGSGGSGGLLDVSGANSLYAWSGDEASYTLAADLSNNIQPSFRFSDESGNSNLAREYLNARSLNFTGTSKGSTVLVNASRSDQNYLGNSLTLASGELFNEAREGALVSYAHEFSPSWGEFKYNTAYDWQRRNIPRDATDNLRSDIIGSRFTNTLSGRVFLPGNFYTETGATYDYRNARRYQNYYSNTGTPESDNSLNNRINQECSAHLQLGFDNELWKLLAGARYTHNNSAGDNVSSRISAIYMVNQHNSFKAMFSQSFRSPTPFEQYFLTPSTTVIGNPGLKPEKADTYELSYLGSHGKFFGHITAYHTIYRESIFRNKGNFTREGISYLNKNFYDNSPGYTSTGAEIILRYEAKHARAFAGLEYLYASRGDEHAVGAGSTAGSSWNFKHVPAYTFSGGFSRDIKDFFIASTLSGYGKSRSLRSNIDAQLWADASAGYKKGDVRHALAVKNLTGRIIKYPEYVRQGVVESIPIFTGRRVEYSFEYRF